MIELVAVIELIESRNNGSSSNSVRFGALCPQFGRLWGLRSQRVLPCRLRAAGSSQIRNVRVQKARRESSEWVGRSAYEFTGGDARPRNVRKGGRMTLGNAYIFRTDVW